MRLIPGFPGSAEPETAYQRGARCLRWVIETGVTVTVATVDLERCDVAAGEAIIAATDEDMRQRLSAVRHAVLATLRIRRAQDGAERKQQAQQAQCTGSQEDHDQRPNLGPMAPLSPRPRTPAPAQEADIAF